MLLEFDYVFTNIQSGMITFWLNSAFFYFNLVVSD